MPFAARLKDSLATLNPAQYKAATATDGPVLVIAGAGTGKTRTIVHRLAYLVGQGVDPASILLLTFTRKAAAEMLDRATAILGSEAGLAVLPGGTFHATAYSLLRRFATAAGLTSGFSLLDRSDAEDLISQAKQTVGAGKADRSFPKRSAVVEILSKARNKECDLADLLSKESSHLLPYLDELAAIGNEFARLKTAHSLLDYDDLLFFLEHSLRTCQPLIDFVASRYEYVLVDEYQDTNPVQARLVRLLAASAKGVMAVGDDAQSIYAFRGASVENILRFPHEFVGCQVIYLEQNYRSRQPVLDLTNAVLAGAERKYDKRLFSERGGDEKPELIRPISDLSQARLVATKVAELARTIAPHDICVLFRAGYMSFPIEVELTKRGLGFVKYGGQRFSEAAHVKDVLAFMRLSANRGDLPSWNRLLAKVKGVGPKTASKIHTAIVAGDAASLEKHAKKYAELGELLRFLDELAQVASQPKPDLPAIVARVVKAYQPWLEREFPEDYPRRQAGLEELETIAAGYASLELFLADLTLDHPGNKREDAENKVVLSTVHSAKGLEWPCVLVIDVVDDRFPSRHAQLRPADLEEERRLLYVAATRAREKLFLFAPQTLIVRGSGVTQPAKLSQFVREVDGNLVNMWRETHLGGLAPEGRQTQQAHGASASPFTSSQSATPSFGAGSAGGAGNARKLGFCRHKVFGRGKIVETLEGNKFRVNFPQFGLKVMLGDYLDMTEE